MLTFIVTQLIIIHHTIALKSLKMNFIFRPINVGASAPKLEKENH